MKLKFVIPIALATTCLSLVRASLAQSYTETGDAGDLPSTAQVIPGVAGITFTSIIGSTAATNGLYDSDMYQITVATPETFSASTTAFVAGANNFDTQLALFNSSGVGVVDNDDASTGGNQSAFSTGTTLLVPGTYYLLISGSGRYAVDSTGALIFPNFTDGTTDPSTTVSPSSTNAITGYTGNSNEGGNYVIAVSVVPQAIPEPSPFAAIAAGTTGLAFIVFRRRPQTSR